MSYSATSFANGITGKALNNIEKQYSEAKGDIDLHGHPSVHYPKASSDAKFFPIASGLDADKVDGNHAADLMGYLLPKGVVIMHKATSAEFSGGYLIADPRWHWCDGSTINGIASPDMRGFFPKCPTASSTTGTGGAATATLTGTVTVSDHTLTVAELPSHYHKIRDRYFGGGISIISYASGKWLITPSSSNVLKTTTANHSGADEGHNHGTNSASFTAINLTPQYKAYHFLIKVAD